MSKVIFSLSRVVDSVEGSFPVEYDLDGLKALLYRAAAEEVQAYYQYILPAKFLVGPLRPDIEKEFVENAKDELDDHFDKLLTRLNQIGADVTPIDSLDKLGSVAVGKYVAPEPPYDVSRLLMDNINAEKEAIQTYRLLCDYSKEFDPVTHKMAKEILADEEEHLSDLQDLFADVSSLQ